MEKETLQGVVIDGLETILREIDAVIRIGNAARASLVRKGTWTAATEGTQAQRDLAAKRLGALTKVTGSIRYNSETMVVNGPVRDFNSKPISTAAFMDIYSALLTRLFELNVAGSYAEFEAQFKSSKNVDFPMVAGRIVESYHNFLAFCAERSKEKSVDKPASTSRQTFEEEEVAVY